MSTSSPVAVFVRLKVPPNYPPTSDNRKVSEQSQRKPNAPTTLHQKSREVAESPDYDPARCHSWTIVQP
jgi:hypothetical protein